ncbi:MAG: TIGR04002 family protein [Ruminococcus sp.]|nr:TIGR04002 family protein [Ruminococcus sp.]
MKKSKYYNLVLAALFASMIFVLTFFVKIPAPLGYIHLGDSAIYLAASLLPTPYAIAAAGIGGAMADVAGGYWAFVPVTFIVKILLALVFSSKGEHVLGFRNIIAPIICFAITVFGYFAFEIFYYGNAAYYEMLLNLIQAVGSAIVYYLFAAVFDGAKLKNRFATAG